MCNIVHLNVVQDELAKARYKSSEAAQLRAHQSVTEVHYINLLCTILHIRALIGIGRKYNHIDIPFGRSRGFQYGRLTISAR